MDCSCWSLTQGTRGRQPGPRLEEASMPLANSDVLISGAGVAGPTLAYWLARYGFTPTVIERTPALRAGLGGHAVDLFGPAVDVVEWMGILPKVQAARTRTDLLVFERPGRAPVAVELSRLVAGVATRHVEIIRGELVSILYQATRNDVEYRFGDAIRTLHQDGDGVEVTFERSAPRRFGLVVGADGLYSGVRRLAFGDEARFRHWLGGYLGVCTLPNYLGLDGRMVIYTVPGKVAAMYPVRQTGEARAVLLFRAAEEAAYDHRDLDQQRRLLREAFGAGLGAAPPACRAGGRQRLLLRLDQPDPHAQLVEWSGDPGRRCGLLSRPGGRRRDGRRGRRRLRAGGRAAGGRWRPCHGVSELRARATRAGPTQPHHRPEGDEDPDPEDPPAGLADHPGDAAAATAARDASGTAVVVAARPRPGACGHHPQARRGRGGTLTRPGIGRGIRPGPRRWILGYRHRAAPQGPRARCRAAPAQVAAGLELLDELAGWGLVPPVMLADAAYGEVNGFRLGLEQREFAYVVQVPGTLSAYPSHVAFTQR